jgi:hypothetical protein
MNTLKISLVATVAVTAAWWLHVPHKIMPEHPRFASFLLALVLCILLRMVWRDSDSKATGLPKETTPPK